MRPIDADAIEYPEYFNSEEAHPDPFIEGFRQGKIDAICEVRALTPTIDAVPVVRCKDCKHWDKFVGEEHRGFCFAWKVDSYDEDFCSYGMRKENNND